MEHGFSESGGRSTSSRNDGIDTSCEFCHADRNVDESAPNFRTRYVFYAQYYSFTSSTVAFPDNLIPFVRTYFRSQPMVLGPALYQGSSSVASPSLPSSVSHLTRLSRRGTGQLRSIQSRMGRMNSQGMMLKGTRRGGEELNEQ